VASLLVDYVIVDNDEVCHSSDTLWQAMTFYPGWRRAERLRQEWLRVERQKLVGSRASGKALEWGGEALECGEEMGL
jgi:hypothetical protein